METSKFDPGALHRLTYGLFVLSTQIDGRDNGCIINTVMQVAENPTQISIAVNKKNFSCDTIMRTGEFNVSILTTQTPFSIFERFGFASGRDTDKFAGFEFSARAENGLMHLTKYVNAVLSAKVIASVDLSTHMLFIAQVTQAQKLSNAESVTYQYYFDHIKPRPAAKKGYVCKICGYVYEGDELPEDFVCPLCKHGAQDFEPLGQSAPKPAKAPEEVHCSLCFWQYDEKVGVPEQGIAPGTAWEDVPDTFTCPLCGMAKSFFKKV